MSMDPSTYVVSVSTMTDKTLALNDVWEATAPSGTAPYAPTGFDYTYQMTF